MKEIENMKKNKNRNTIEQSQKSNENKKSSTGNMYEIEIDENDVANNNANNNNTAAYSNTFNKKLNINTLNADQKTPK